MLWSIIPQEVVFDGLEDCTLLDYQLENCPCRLRRLPGGDFGLEAVCSTNPKHFLQSNLQPGRRIFLPK